MTFIIRDVPDSMHRQLKADAALQGKTIQSLIREIIAAYLAAAAEGKEGKK